jgi:hypothetical protein
MTTNRHLRYQAASVYLLALIIISSAFCMNWIWP